MDCYVMTPTNNTYGQYLFTILMDNKKVRILTPTDYILFTRYREQGWNTVYAHENRYM